MATPLCILCAKPKSDQRPGATYELQSDRLEKLTAWICNDCAIPLGPPQGPVVPYRKGMKTKL